MVNLEIADAAMRMTGTRAVKTEMPKPGISSSLKIFGLYMPLGISGLISLVKLQYKGPATMAVGMAMAAPYNKVVPISAL